MSQRDKSAIRKGRIVPSLLLLVVFALCLLGLRAMVSSARLALAQRGWIMTDCAIDRAELTGMSPELKLEVSYHYLVDGRQLTGARYTLPSPVVISDQELRQEERRLVEGTTVACYFDPADPSVVVLRREPLSSVFMVGLPLVFGLISAAALKVLWFPRRAGTRSGTKSGVRVAGRGGDDDEEEVWDEKQPRYRIGMTLFFLPFMLIGLGLTYLFFGMPYLAVKRAQAWQPHTCKVTSSEVRTHPGSKDSKASYSLEVTYTYEFGGRRFAGDRYSVADLSLSSWSEGKAIEEKLVEGGPVDCFVNPDDPKESALTRELPSTVWGGLFPLIFFFAGLGGFLHSLGLLTREDGDVESTKKGRPFARPAQSRFKGILRSVLVALIWNGITGMIGYGIWLDWQRGAWPIFPTLIWALFALLGVLILAGIPYAILQAFNPAIDLELSHPAPRLGSEFTVSWRLKGSSSRVRRLVITLDLLSLDRENVPRDTSASPRKLIENRRVHSIQIVSTTQSQQIERGRMSVRIPVEAELPADPNDRRREWLLSARLEIPWFPDGGESLQLDYVGEQNDD